MAHRAPSPFARPASRSRPLRQVFNIKSPSIHNVLLTDLTPSTFYWYKVGSPVYGWSIAYNFTSKQKAGDATYPITWLAYGDMGISNSQNTADFTAALIQSGEAQFITHAGDISYADNRASINNGSIYEGVLNDFYNEVQPSSAYAAYMTSSGNHEAIVDFLAYRNRNSPSLPQNGGLFWYSFNFGPIHFLAFDIDQPYEAGTPQYVWMMADLAAIDRAVTPWVVAYNHFPLMCSNLFWCPGALKFQAVWEPIFNAPATKVDLTYAGHVHAAEVPYPQVGGVVEKFGFDNIKSTMQVSVLTNNACANAHTRRTRKQTLPNPNTAPVRTPPYLFHEGHGGLPRRHRGVLQ